MESTDKPLEEMTREEIIAEIKSKHDSIYGYPFRKSRIDGYSGYTDNFLKELLIPIRIRWSRMLEIQAICDTELKPIPAGRYGSVPVFGEIRKQNACGGGRRVLHCNKSLQ